MNREIAANKSFIEKYIKIIIVLAVVAGSASGIFGKLIEAPSMAIGFWRLTISLPFFALPVLTKQREELKAVSKKSLMWSFIAGAFLFAHFFSWFTGVKLTDIGSAVVLAALHPLVVLVLTVFVFKRKVGIRAVFGIVLALLGGAIIAGFDYRQFSSDNFVGDVLAFLAAIFMGFYFTIGHEVRKKVPGPVYVFLIFLSCWLCFFMGVIVTKTPIFSYSMRDYMLLIALTLVCQIGSQAVFNLSFGHVDSLYVSAWESGEAVFAIMLGMIFLNQFPTPVAILGCIITVTGLLYYNYSSQRMKESEEEARGN